MCHGLPFKAEEPVTCIKTQTVLEVRWLIPINQSSQEMLGSRLECNCTAPRQQHHGKDTLHGYSRADVTSSKLHREQQRQFGSPAGWLREGFSAELPWMFQFSSYERCPHAPTLCVSVKVIGVCAFFNIHWIFFSFRLGSKGHAMVDVLSVLYHTTQNALNRPRDTPVLPNTQIKNQKRNRSGPRNPWDWTSGKKSEWEARKHSRQLDI